jgi:hypothetical protein
MVHPIDGQGFRIFIEDAGCGGDPLIRAELGLQFTQRNHERQPRVCSRLQLGLVLPPRPNRHRRKGQHPDRDQGHENQD